jgi:hypothetical protein
MSLQDALSDLCDRKQLLLLATPYLTFESRFIERAGPDLRIRATMSRNVVRHALNQQSLRLRFPWGLTFFAGATRILDYEEGDKAKFLRITAPTVLAPDDLRKAYRVEQVGRSTGALGSQELDLVRISLENISAHGIGVFCMEPLPSTGFQLGRRLNISLSLDHGPHLQATGRICHSTGQSLGLAFTPELAPATLAALNTWLEPRIEEAQRRWDDRATLRAQAERAAQPKEPPGGILLVTSDGDLQAAVTAALNGTQSLRCVPTALAPFKASMEQQPPLVLILGATGGLEESHRLRSMLETVSHTCPVVVLGSGTDMDSMRAFASEIRATLFLDRNTLNSAFFQRLLLGLIRKHWNLLEGGGLT